MPPEGVGHLRKQRGVIRDSPEGCLRIRIKWKPLGELDIYGSL